MSTKVQIMKRMHGAKIDPLLVEQARAAAWWVGRGWNLGRIIVEGTLRQVTRLEKKFNKGEPFPPPPEDRLLEGGKLRRPTEGKRHPHGTPPRKSTAFRLDVELIERLRNAAAARDVSQVEVIEAGMRAVLAELQAAHNDGEEFPPPADE